MKVTFELNDKIVQSYLDHFNEVQDTNYQLNTLTPIQLSGVIGAFADEAVGEFEMRTDDHDGFDTSNMFVQVFDEIVHTE